MNKNQYDIVNKAVIFVDQNLNNSITITDVCNYCEISYPYLAKIFKKITGYNLQKYIKARRITLATYYILTSKEKIVDIAANYGYNSNAAFTRVFIEVQGISPSMARTADLYKFKHIPFLHYDELAPNEYNIKYQIVKDKVFKFVGRSLNLKRESEIIINKEEVKAKMQSVCDEVGIKDIYSDEKHLYRVQYNDVYNQATNKYFAGVIDRLEKYNDFLELKLKPSNYVRITANGPTTEAITNLRTKIIISEYLDMTFEYNGLVEVINTHLNQDGTYTLDYYYSFE